MKNIFACLVHEKQECIVDLVRNLNYLDPTSPILLYNGGTDKKLFQGFPFDRYGAEIIPGSRPLKWGWLHDFALDCMRYALKNLNFDILTIVDSDQLGTAKNYSQYMEKYLDNKEIGMFGITDQRQLAGTKVDPALTAYQEKELWLPFLEKFPGGIDKFLYWTFWPSTVFTRAAAQDLVKLFDADEQLREILKKTRIWASEEIILPTLVALLGYRVEENPCSYNYVKYGAAYSLTDIERALRQPDTFWVHPVPRDPGNALRKSIAAHFDYYKKRPAQPGSTAGKRLLTGGAGDNNHFISSLSIGKQIKNVEGWLDDEEAQLLLYSAHDVLEKQNGDAAVVEIGSYCGKATIVLGSLLKEMGYTSPCLYAIDLFDGVIGAADTVIEKRPPTHVKFMANICRAGLKDIVRPVVSRSFQLENWEIPVGFLLIDGLHDYTNVARDFYSFEKWVVQGGYIAFHDYADYFPGVKTFVDELLLSGKYREVALENGMMVIEKIFNEKEAAIDNKKSVIKSPPRQGHREKALIVLCGILFFIWGIFVFIGINHFAGTPALQKEYQPGRRGWNKEKTIPEKKPARIEALEFKLFAFERMYPQFGQIAGKVYEEAGKNKLSPYIVLSVIQVESNFDPRASSGVAHGLMQINLEAWKNFFNIDENKIYDIDYNIALGCKILKHYLDECGGDIVRALFLYNNGYLYNNEKYVPKVQGSIFLQDIPVSCIMPTADRREFVPRAITYFLNQDYKNKELIIIDDGADKIADLVPQIHNIKYISLDKKHTVGAKRNLACREASGEIIIHWDDDDWMAPGWIRCQVHHLLKTNADITGLDRPYFYSPDLKKAWQYIYPAEEKPWVHGGTLCYTKATWRNHPFPEINVAEDLAFLWSNGPQKIIPHPGIELYIALIHGKNVSPKYTWDCRWKVEAIETISRIMKKF